MAFQGLFALFAASVTAVTPTAIQAQTEAPAPIATAPAASVPPTASIDPAADAYFAAHPGPLWLRDDDGRSAAATLAARLKDAAIEGLPNAPDLGAQVEAAVSRGQPADEKIIASAWLAYVKALNRPVDHVGYGETTLQMTLPASGYLLEQAGKATSLSAFVNHTTALNPFYQALRSNAVKQSLTNDARVKASLDRLRLIPARGRALLVDVANAELLMLEDGQVADRMKVIVGKPDFQTPLLAGKIYYVTFNPYWHIPQDVARRKVAPIVLKRGTSYLKAARYETVAAFGGDQEQPVDPSSVDWKAVAAGDVDAHIRQLAGPGNMMGAMKFGFVNDDGIYLHDTPHKELFAKAKRTLSLGCVRVEQPQRLAAWLLGRDAAPPNDGVEQLVQLDAGVPIYILYLTARPDGDGVAFADDVYHLDGGAAVTALATADQAPAN